MDGADATSAGNLFHRATAMHPGKRKRHMQVYEVGPLRQEGLKFLSSRHVQFISKTATKAVGVIQEIYQASSKTLLRMFLTVVRPLLECAAVWESWV